METILDICEVANIEIDKWNHVDGFKITTTEQQIILAINNGQSCCESWGYFMSQDDFTEFLGAQVLSIKIVDEALNVKQLEGLWGDECYVMFVNIETSTGRLQFVAHNSHNGYYGHTAYVISKQIAHSETL